MLTKQSNSLLRLITYLTSKDADLPLTRLQTFLIIAKKKECLVRDLTNATGLNQATIARSLGALSDKPSRSNKSGLRWVEMFADPADHRRMLVRVAPAGHKVLTELSTMLE